MELGGGGFDEASWKRLDEKQDAALRKRLDHIGK